MTVKYTDKAHQMSKLKPIALVNRRLIFDRYSASNLPIFRVERIKNSSGSAFPGESRFSAYTGSKSLKYSYFLSNFPVKYRAFEDRWRAWQSDQTE